jgi:hypothetical protein
MKKGICTLNNSNKIPSAFCCVGPMPITIYQTWIRNCSFFYADFGSAERVAKNTWKTIN